MTTATHYLIAFASRWGTALGGINSFNTDLLKALGVAVDGNKAKIICVVLDASRDDIDDAIRCRVNLLSLNKKDLTDYEGDFNLKDNILLLLKSDLANAKQVIWLGHDRITGYVANAMAKTVKGSRSAVIHHMSYKHYESFIENSLSANLKFKKQKSIFSEADILFGVGPLLRDALIDMINRPESKVFCLIPGLLEFEIRENPTKSFTVFMSGRISEETNKLKQASLALSGFAKAIQKSDQDDIHKSLLKGVKQPRIVLRGLDDRSKNIEEELKLFAEEIAKRPVSIIALPFTTDREELLDELKSSNIAIMPSWHEGFGLVAWEAIASGIPLILSKQTGVYEFLESLGEERLLDSFIGLDIKGKEKHPFYTEEDQSNVANSILKIEANYAYWKQKAILLREELLRNYTWKNCAENLFKALNWQSLLITQQVKINQSVEVFPIDKVQKKEKVFPSVVEIPSPLPFSKGLSLSVLLRAEQEIIPFDEKRKPLLNEQITWALETEYPLAIRLITGVGGSGKTRLALQLCKELLKQNWQAGFLRSNFFSQDIDKLITEIEDRKRHYCIVIDYAETRVELLIDLFKLLIKYDNLKIRILLLARDRGEWWEELKKKDFILEALLFGLVTTEPLPISRMYEELDREQAYKKAIQCFADELDIELGEQYYVPNLAQNYFSSPLYIQMAALLALQGEQSETSEQLPRALVNREQRYWCNLTIDQSEFDQAYLLMFLATIIGKIKSIDAIESLYKELGFKNRNEAANLFNKLKSLYPSQHVLEGLKPDLLGESLVVEALLSNKEEPIKLIKALFNMDNDEAKYHCLVILSRTLVNRSDCFYTLKQLLIDYLVDPWFISLYFSIYFQSDHRVLHDLFLTMFNELSDENKLQTANNMEIIFIKDIPTLVDIEITVSQYMIDFFSKRLITLEDRMKYVESLTNFATALYRKGNYEYALSIIKTASNLAKEILFITNSINQEFLLLYINIQNDESVFLSKLDRKEEALKTIRDAINLFKTLIDHQDSTEIYASLLSSYSNRLAENSQISDSLVYIEETVNIYKDLYNKFGLEEYGEEYARALSNYANRLYDSKVFSKAIDIAKKALEIRKKIYSLAPLVYCAEYASSLHNYTLILLGSKKDVVNEIELIGEAVNIRYNLSKHNPEKFILDYASSLAVYSECLYRLNKKELALKNLDPVIKIYEEYLGKDNRFYQLALKKQQQYINSI